MGSHQVVSKHSILSAQRNIRDAAIEFREEASVHSEPEWLSRLEEIKQLWKRRKKSSRRRSRRDHAPCRRRRSGEVSEKNFEIYLDMKLQSLQQFYVNAKSRKSEERRGTVEFEKGTDWGEEGEDLASDKEPLPESLLSPKSPPESLPSPGSESPLLPNYGVTLVEWKSIHGLGEMLLSLWVEMCNRKEKKEKVTEDLHRWPPEPPEPPDQATFAVEEWMSHVLIKEERKMGQPHFVSQIETVTERTTRNFEHNPNGIKSKPFWGPTSLQLRRISSTLVLDFLCCFCELCSWPLSLTSSIGGDNLKGYDAKNVRAITLYILEAIIMENMEAMVPETPTSVVVLVSSSHYHVSFLHSVLCLLKPIIPYSLSKNSHDERLLAGDSCLNFEGLCFSVLSTTLKQKNEAKYRRQQDYFEATLVRIGRRWSLWLITNSYVPRSDDNFYFQISRENLMGFSPTLKVEIVLQVKFENDDGSVIMDALICVICTQSKSNGHDSSMVKQIKLLVEVGRRRGSALRQLTNIPIMVESPLVHEWDPGGIKEEGNIHKSTSKGGMECPGSIVHLYHQVFFNFQQIIDLVGNYGGDFMSFMVPKSSVTKAAHFNYERMWLQEAMEIENKWVHSSTLLVDINTGVGVHAESTLFQNQLPFISHDIAICGYGDYIDPSKSFALVHEISMSGGSICMTLGNSSVGEIKTPLILIQDHEKGVTSQEEIHISNFIHSESKILITIGDLYEFMAPTVRGSSIANALEYFSYISNQLKNCVLSKWFVAKGSMRQMFELILTNDILHQNGAATTLCFLPKNTAGNLAFDPGDSSLVSCMAWPSCFTLWDPGGRL